ncbi:MAG: 4-hydroxy-3-methylbut-2-enyl diphosphate reductase [Planctomycetota bacterium]|nr:MAG: 4-hydroxy-3-methylbut-2-enyl diphosphate reductase [Planctomycetota bacterium]
MKVLRADKLGFCNGVERAIGLAENALERKDKVYSFGPIIHNKEVVDRLAEKGLSTVESLDQVHNGTVLIRSHGVSPQVLAAIDQTDRELVDATCVLVRRAQDIVKQLHEEGYQVVMIGDANHPEVKSIIGYAPDVIVIDRPQDLDRLPKGAKLGVVVQTTHSQKQFGEMLGHIATRPFREIRAVNTLCLEVARRQEAALALCSRVDIMFVLGGHHSANTQELARLCRAQGVTTYHLENWGSFSREYVNGHKTAGITAGASTPPWVIDEFIKNLEAL